MAELTKEQIDEQLAELKKLQAANKQLEANQVKLAADLKKAIEAKDALTQNLKDLQKELDSAESLNDELQAKINGAGPAAAKLTFELDKKQYRAVHAVVVPGDREYSAAEIAANKDLQKQLIKQQSSAIEEVINPE